MTRRRTPGPSLRVGALIRTPHGLARVRAYDTTTEVFEVTLLPRWVLWLRRVFRRPV